MPKRQKGFPFPTSSFGWAAHTKLQRWMKGKSASQSCHHFMIRAIKTFWSPFFLTLLLRCENMTISILQHINLSVITACLWQSQHRVRLWSNGAWQALPFPSTSECFVAMPSAAGKYCTSTLFIWYCYLRFVASHKLICSKNFPLEKNFFLPHIHRAGKTKVLKSFGNNNSYLVLITQEHFASILSFNCHNNLWRKYYYYPHFIAQET